MHVSIISVGSEVVSGMITDTNATFASQNLFDRGYEILFHHAIGDHQESFAQLLNSLKTPINIVGGGLGPTFDDVTRNSAAQAFQSPLQFHPELWEDLKARYSKIKDSNQVQCYLPQKAKILPNLYGTAPGFYLEDHGRYYFFLPGVPREFTKMFSEQVLPRLSECGDPPPYRETKFFKVIGYTESSLNEHLRSIIDPEIFNGIFAGEGCITLKFVTTGDPVVAKKRLAEQESLLRKTLGTHIFSTDLQVTLAQAVVELLQEKKATLATAESCTGGLLAGEITQVSGASQIFLEGIVSYSNAAKEKRLQVSSETLARYGAVSEETAREMAIGLRKQSQADYTLSITGIAGPTGGSPEKPVGFVCFGITTPQETFSTSFQFPGDREIIRRRSVTSSLYLLRKALLQEPLAPFLR